MISPFSPLLASIKSSEPPDAKTPPLPIESTSFSSTSSSFFFVGKCSFDEDDRSSSCCCFPFPIAAGISLPRSFNFSNRAFSRLALTLFKTVSSSSSSSFSPPSSLLSLFKKPSSSSSSKSSSDNPILKCLRFNPFSKSFKTSSGSKPSNPKPAFVKLPRIKPIASVTLPCRHLSSFN